MIVLFCVLEFIFVLLENISTGHWWIWVEGHAVLTCHSFCEMKPEMWSSCIGCVSDVNAAGWCDAWRWGQAWEGMRLFMNLGIRKGAVMVRSGGFTRWSRSTWCTCLAGPWGWIWHRLLQDLSWKELCHLSVSHHLGLTRRVPLNEGPQAVSREGHNRKLE